jgi:hypothetical protein
MKPALVSLLLLLLASHAFAHRLDEYLQATRIAIATNRIDVSLELTPGAAVASQFLPLIDKNGDGQFSDEERAAYVQRVLKDLQAGLDEKPLTWRPTNTSFPTLPEIKAGEGVIRIKASATVGPLAAGKHALTLTNTHLPVISVYLVNALVPQDPALKITKQIRDEFQKGYRLEFSASLAAPSR